MAAEPERGRQTVAAISTRPQCTADSWIVANVWNAVVAARDRSGPRADRFGRSKGRVQAAHTRQQSVPCRGNPLFDRIAFDGLEIDQLPADDQIFPRARPAPQQWQVVRVEGPRIIPADVAQ